MSEFKTNLLSGIKWSFINKVLFQALSLMITIILARMLSPDEFGIFAMITVFASFATLFSDFGLGNSLIYYQDADERDYSTVFYANIIIGLLITLLFYFLAPTIAHFYNEPDLTRLIQIFSSVFLIQSVGQVSIALLRKNIKFKKLGIIENIALLLSGIIAVLASYFEMGAMSLVLKSIIYAFVLTISVLLFSRFKPYWYFSLDRLKVLSGYGVQTMSNMFITYWIRNADNLIIGKILGNVQLGFYNMAYKIMLLPINNISRVISQVMFPSFSSINNDLSRLRNSYLKIIQTVALLTFPIFGGLFMLSNEFIRLVLGSHWIEIDAYLPVLALVALPQSIFTLNGSVFQSIGRPDIPLKINLVSFPLYLLAFYFGLEMNGVTGLVYNYAILSAALFIPIYVLLAKHIKLSLLIFFNNLLPAITGTFVMSLFIFFYRKFIYFNEYPFLWMTFCVFGAIIVYGGFTILVWSKKIEVLKLVKNR
tara:strand:- start:3496 stop:4935 length:1440 start_codon:yes stop_codon:yes gene_type:complete